jgi:hypothetical protein
MQRLVVYGMLVVVLKILDLYTTWLRTPDLAREMNPITRLLGVSWTTVLLQQLVLTVLTLWFVRRSLIPDRSFCSSKRDLTLKTFVAHLFFEEPSPWWHVLYRLPTRPGALRYSLAGITLFLVPLAHIQAGTSNWLLTRSALYEHWFDAYLPLSWYSEIAVVALLAICLFVRRDYLACRQSNALPI